MGQTKRDKITQMKTMTGDFYLVTLSKYKTFKFDHSKRLITLTRDYNKQVSMLD